MKVILGAACGLLLMGLGLIGLSMHSMPAPIVKIRTPTPHVKASAAPMGKLALILEDHDADRRHARLREWADGIGKKSMESVLNETQQNESPLARSELRQALLFSWTSRDLIAVAKWFGTPGKDYDLHQEGRDQLVLALLQCNPADVLPALRTALPVETSQELYGPYFRAWAATDPGAAADAALRQLAEAERKGSPAWQDLIAQVTAQWMQTDPDRAIAWLQALPDGAAKTKAELQTSYRWTELNPIAASAYAAQKNNPQLLQTVAGKWAETNPKAAIEWANKLSSERAQSRALAGAGCAWAQIDPYAAAAYAASLSESPQRVAFMSAVASAWACSDPDAVADWLQTLPPGESRNHAINILAAALPATSS